jgi:hypothetical protein
MRKLLSALMIVLIGLVGLSCEQRVWEFPSTGEFRIHQEATEKPMVLLQDHFGFDVDETSTIAIRQGHMTVRTEGCDRHDRRQIDWQWEDRFELEGNHYPDHSFTVVPIDPGWYQLHIYVNNADGPPDRAILPLWRN